MALCVSAPTPRLQASIVFALVNPANGVSERKVPIDPHILEPSQSVSGSRNSWGCPSCYSESIDSYVRYGSITFEMEVSVLLDACKVGVDLPTSFKTRGEPLQLTVHDFGALLDTPLHSDVTFEVLIQSSSSSTASSSSTSASAASGLGDGGGLDASSSSLSLDSSFERIPAHKNILAARSEVFRAMFAHPMQEQKENVVHIDDMTPKTVHHLLQFIYTGHTDISTWDEAAALLHAAEKYSLPRLKEWCILRLQEHVSVATVLHTLGLIERHGLPQSLRSRCKQIMIDNADQVMTIIGRDWIEVEHERTPVPI